MRRPRVLSFALGLLLGVLIAATTAGASSLGQQLGHTVRFDLVSIVDGGAAGPTVVAGGTDRARDSTTGDTIDLTGSGQAKPSGSDAAGGGTFVHRHADGTEVAHGVWVVNSLASWTPAGGSLPLTDAIGHQSDASAGILELNVTIYPASRPPHPAVVTIHCDLPGATQAIVEGVSVDSGPFHFTQAGGGTLFHILS
jgi:hypothetical protein